MSARRTALTWMALGAAVLSGTASRARLAAQEPAPADSQAFLERALKGVTPLRTEDVQRARALLGRMTLAEKAGQMTQLEIGMVSEGTGTALRIDPAKLRRAVVEHGVGSILNVNDEALPPAQWHEVIRQIQAAAAETRLKIPVLYGIDTIHGANYVAGATLFPQPLGMAATWNPELMEEASRVAAAETRAAGIPWNFSPVLDVGRQPLWPRLYETFGEDAYLASVMAAAAVRGYQGQDPASPTQVAACMKHYVGYSLPTTGHDRTPALIPERTLREHFLPPFAAGVKAGALTVMVNSGEVNGVPGHVNRFLLTDVLHGELGFEGLVVSDWEDIKKLVSIHRVAATEKEATRAAVLAGIDMSMVPSDYSFTTLLQQLVQEGAVPISRIDEAVGRILAVKSRLGLFEDPLRGLQGGTVVGSPASRALALRAARESITLLKNEGGVLPLPEGTRVLVTGPTADSLPALNNGWTWTWQGDRAAAYPKDRPTVLGALRARLGPERVLYAPGATYDKEADVATAAAAAREADVAIVCLGELSYAETPGNIDDLALPEAQVRLAQAVAAAGRPIVLVLIEGRPRVIRAVADAARAIVMAYNPGMEGGQAVADVLLGDVNPSGKLPLTYPRHPHALRTYDHKAFEELDTAFGLKAYQPQFDFGSGLSYTTFAYSGLSVEPREASSGDVTVSVTVANTGSRAGAEVVQVYVSDHVATVTPPVKRLVRFAKVALEPGQRRALRFRLTRDDLAFVGADNRRLAEPGEFTVRVGGLNTGFSLK